YLVADKIDSKVLSHLQKAILKSYKTKGVRGATFGNAPTADGFAVLLTLGLAPGKCGGCGEQFRRLITGFSYSAMGVDVTDRIESVLAKHGTIRAHQFVCPRCGSPDNKSTERHDDLSLLDRQ